MTDETNRNREIITRFYNAGIAGDLETFFGSLDPAITVNEPPFLTVAGVHEGVDAFKEVFVAIAELLDMSSLKVESITVDGDRAFAVLHARIRVTGEQVSLCEEWRLRDGRIVSARVWWWDPAPASRG